MTNTSAGLLEFEALRQLLGRYISSPLGTKELAKVAPSADRALLEQVLADTAEAIEYVIAAAKPHPAARGAPVRIRFDALADPDEALRKLKIEGAVLEAKEIQELTALLDRADDIKRLLASMSERFPRLAARSRQLAELRPLLRDLAGKIDPDGAVADDASPVLARLRRDIDRQRKLLQESLEQFLRRHGEEGLLQEQFVTIRNDRFVVPVIAGQQRRIEGVVHGSSGSGHTLFVEPLQTIELNNELVRLTDEELSEVHRILREMTARLRDCLPSIESTVAALGELELLFAKARFAADFGCVIPRFSVPPARRVLLRDARHPLLEDVLSRLKKQAVPVSLTLDNGCRTLLISGPNTGGKTVTLKTVGLLALMAQAGLPVPCAEAELPVFGQVLADIGDNQSIQESLSTFSAHVSRIREMLDEADSDSLVLLDELGRATDPEEGGALGVSVLERFRSHGAFTLASTHLLALKMYAASTGGVLNGSMGFNETTLEPTYVLRLGAPGKSAGLEIAQRLGLAESLIDEARLRLGSREQDIGRFLAELHRRLEEIGALEKELAAQKAAFAARQESLEREWSRKEAAKLKEIERRSHLVLEKFEADARQAIERFLATAEDRKAAASASRRVSALKRELREELDTTVLATRDEARQGDLVSPASQVREGSSVRLRGVREPARVRRLLAGGLIEVESGMVKLQAPLDDVLEVLPAEAASRGLPRQVRFQPATPQLSASREINVIGMHAEEAIGMVEKFLDNAVLAGLTRVRIVHGHGMGILRRAVSELLEKNPNVERHYPAPQSEGGAGATIVELKD